MGSHLHDVNIALARCDLERVVGDHLRSGADPGQLLGELLEMCMNLRKLAQDMAEARRQEAPAGIDWRNAGIGQTDPDGVFPGGGTEFAGMNVRWLRPMTGLRSSSGGHHVERKSDADESLAND